MKDYFVQTVPVKNPPGMGRMTYGRGEYNLNILYAGTRNSIYEENKDKKAPWIREHTHEKVYHLVLYVAGKNKLSVNGVLYDAGRGMLALVPPGCPHIFNPLIKGGSFTYQEISFTFSDMKGNCLKVPLCQIFSYYAGFLIGKVPFVEILNEPLAARLSEKMNSLTEFLWQSGNSSYFSAHASLLDIFARIIVYLCDSSQSDLPEEKTKETLVRIKEYIERKYFEQLTLKGLAKMANVTPEHLCRCFKTLYDIPPLAYQQSLRISAAKNLLHTSSLSCKEISFMVGFSNEQFFSRQFKHITGMSPSSYRKQATGV